LDVVSYISVKKAGGSIDYDRKGECSQVGGKRQYRRSNGGSFQSFAADATATPPATVRDSWERGSAKRDEQLTVHRQILVALKWAR